MTGKELRNSVVGIAGMGRIGFGIAKRLQCFNVAKILYTSRTSKPAGSFSFLLFSFKFSVSYHYFLIKIFWIHFEK